MPISSSFHTTVKNLLKQYNIAITPKSDHDVYLLTLGEKLEVHLIGTQQGYLNLACTIGELNATTPQAMLKTLLAVNHPSLTDPAFQIGLDADTENVVLAVRESLANLDSVNSYALLKQFIDKAVQLHDWLKNQPIM